MKAMLHLWKKEQRLQGGGGGIRPKEISLGATRDVNRLVDHNLVQADLATRTDGREESQSCSVHEDHGSFSSSSTLRHQNMSPQGFTRVRYSFTIFLWQLLYLLWQIEV